MKQKTDPANATQTCSCAPCPCTDCTCATTAHAQHA